MEHVAQTSTGDAAGLPLRGGCWRPPLTLGLLVLQWAVGAASGALLSGPSGELRDLVGAGLGPVSAGRWWVPLTAPLWASGLPGYLWSTAVGVLGTRKAAALALLVQLLGTALGLGFVALVAIRGARRPGPGRRGGGPAR